MAKVAFQTYGCSNNFAETESMTGLLNKNGHKVTEKEEADVIVMNLCTVKGDSKALKLVKEHKEKYPDKKFILTGCIPDYAIKKFRKIVPDSNVITTHNIDKINEATDSVLEGKQITLRQRTKLVKSDLPSRKINDLVGIIPICSGCTSHCTYCSTKLVKGNLTSYPVDSIVDKAKELIEDNVKEIWLTSQDNGDYGKDIGTNPAFLLKKIANLKGKFMIRFGMTNPIRVSEYLDELIEAYKEEKVYKFLHIPVQSGNDEILEKMNRRYTVKEFKNIVNSFRKEIPEINIMTDIICGFPTETEEQFKDTLGLIKEIRPDSLNISRFAARPGTKAYRMEQVHGKFSKERSRELTRIFEPIERENNKKWIGWKGKVFVNEEGKYDGFKARNYAYKQVIIKSDKDLMGKEVNVKITDSGQHDLRGKILSD